MVGVRVIVMKKLFSIIILVLFPGISFELNAKESLEGKQILCHFLFNREVGVDGYHFIDEENVENYYSNEIRKIQFQTFKYQITRDYIHLLKPFSEGYKKQITIDRYTLSFTKLGQPYYEEDECRVIDTEPNFKESIEYFYKQKLREQLSQRKI